MTVDDQLAGLDKGPPPVHEIKLLRSQGHGIDPAYLPEENRGRVARLEYRVSSGKVWVWIELEGADWRRYNHLAFDVKYRPFDAEADPALPNPLQLKVEMKRADGREIKVYYVENKITSVWHKERIYLDLPDVTTYTKNWDGWTQMEDLVYNDEPSLVH